MYAIRSYYESKFPNEVLQMEYIKLLIEMGKKDEAAELTLALLTGIHKGLTRHYCSQCGYNSDDIFWRCPQCYRVITSYSIHYTKLYDSFF